MNNCLLLGGFTKYSSTYHSSQFDSIHEGVETLSVKRINGTNDISVTNGNTSITVDTAVVAYSANRDILCDNIDVMIDGVIKQVKDGTIIFNDGNQLVLIDVLNKKKNFCRTKRALHRFINTYKINNTSLVTDSPFDTIIIDAGTCEEGAFNQSISLTLGPSKGNYTFTGWYVGNSDGTSTSDYFPCSGDNEYILMNSDIICYDNAYCEQNPGFSYYGPNSFCYDGKLCTEQTGPSYYRIGYFCVDKNGNRYRPWAPVYIPVATPSIIQPSL
jgi:hypothetical protein